MNQIIYRQILENSVLPWARITYSYQNRILQKDLAPSHLKYLKKTLKAAWGQIDSQMLLRIVAQFPKRLMVCVKAKGTYIQ